MTTAASLRRPWLKLYSAADGGEPVCRFSDGLSMFRYAVRAGAGKPAIHYFDRTISFAELDRLSDAFAAFLLEKGVGTGDRIALYLQNTPAFPLCMLGAWKIGAIAVSINPMNRARELTLLLKDSGARVLVTHRDLYNEVAAPVLKEFPDVIPVTTSVADFQQRNDPRVMNAKEPAHCEGSFDLLQVLENTRPATTPLLQSADGEAPAMLVYTSGTTGIPKGPVIRHSNFAFDAELWRSWARIEDGTPILSIAPLFHITGLIAHVGAAFGLVAPMILSMRFHPEVAAESAEEYQAGFVIGAITAYIAMMNAPGVRPEQFRSLRSIYTGGAPVPAKVAEEFTRKFGMPIRNCYGMTETTALAVGTPPTLHAPVDANGALSIGLPVFDTDAYIADEDGNPLPPGETGEILLRGPQVIAEYWQREDATREAFHNGYLRTGDVAYMNEDGWIFIVDRKKDMISASGYKVWPKEVEDVIYTHPAVREVAVVGVQDAYRGETVKAVVSLRPGASLQPEELISYCKERMAAYKYPRVVEIIEELPKTLTGKILRRELRS